LREGKNGLAIDVYYFVGLGCESVDVFKKRKHFYGYLIVKNKEMDVSDDI
jgi:hypothetical protein